MRQVRFSLYDRVVLIPVELTGVLVYLLAVGLLLGSTPGVAAILAGVVLFPILLPWLPTANFSTKGFILGTLVALPLAVELLLRSSESPLLSRAGLALAYMLILPSVTAYLALNFTGSTPFTSRTGVRREIFAYARTMAWMFGIGLALNLVLILVGALGG